MKQYVLPLVGCGLVSAALQAHAGAPASPGSAFASKGAAAAFPAVPRGKPLVPADCRRLMVDAARHPTAMGCRMLAEACEAAHLCQDAADAYRHGTGCPEG